MGNYEKILEKMCSCPYCNGEMNGWYIGNYRGVYFYTNLEVLGQTYFCTKECYEDYKQNFVVEIYKGEPIYCVEINGEKRYMPYFEANYYFINIDDCKKEMDMDGVAVIGMDMRGF